MHTQTDATECAYAHKVILCKFLTTASRGTVPWSM